MVQPNFVQTIVYFANNIKGYRKLSFSVARYGNVMLEDRDSYLMNKTNKILKITDRK